MIRLFMIFVRQEWHTPWHCNLGVFLFEAYKRLVFLANIIRKCDKNRSKIKEWLSIFTLNSHFCWIIPYQMCVYTYFVNIMLDFPIFPFNKFIYYQETYSKLLYFVFVEEKYILQDIGDFIFFLNCVTLGFWSCFAHINGASTRAGSHISSPISKLKTLSVSMCIHMNLCRYSRPLQF